MRQFDVFRNPSERSRRSIPFVALQSHHLAAMPTAVVAPMLNYEEGAAYSEVSIVVTFKDARYIVSIAELAAVDVRSLGSSVGDVAAAEDNLRRALEKLFTGF